MYYILATAIFILNLLDLLFTKRLIRRFGADIEANPIGRWILEKPMRVVFIKILLIAAMLTFEAAFSMYLTVKILMWLEFALYALLAGYHIFIILYLKKRFGNKLDRIQEDSTISRENCQEKRGMEKDDSDSTGVL